MANSAAQPRNIDFDGVVSAVITTFDQAGQLNEAAFRRVLEYQIEGGVHGFWVAGGTGEGVMLTADENARLMQAAVEQTAGRAKVIGHVGAITTTVAAQQSAAAARAGVDAICAVPAFFGRHDSDELAEHYRVIADAAGDLPFFAYNIPHTTGVDLTPALLRKIRERVPQLVGLKHSAPNTGHIHAFARDGLACLIGHSGMMVPALDMGGAGVVDSTPGVLPELWVGAWDAYQAGDHARARFLQGLGFDAAMQLMSDHAIGSVKAAFSELLGIDCGHARPPYLPISAARRAEVRAFVAEHAHSHETVGAA